MKESAFAASIKKTLKRQGFRAIKWHGSRMGEAGIPDLYVVAKPKWMGWLELKMESNTVTEIQKRNLEDLRKRGVNAYVLRRRKSGELSLEDPDGIVLEFGFDPANLIQILNHRDQPNPI